MCCCSCRSLCCCCLTLAVLAVGLAIAVAVLFPDTNPPITTRAETRRLQRTDTSLIADIDVMANVTNRNSYAIELRSGELTLSYKGDPFFNTTTLPAMTFPAKQTTTYEFQLEINLSQNDYNSKALLAIVQSCAESNQFVIDIAATVRVSLTFIPFSYALPFTSTTTQSCQ